MSTYEVCKFSPAPDPEFVCGICMNVLDIPYQTVCHHVFCHNCIWTALRENSKCPICRTPCTKDKCKAVIPLVQNLINRLTMKCDNYDNGCTELILKEFFLCHIKSCEYAMVQCRFKECSQHLLRKDCEEHEKNLCVYRDRICEGACGLMIPVETKASHNCTEALLTLIKDLRAENLELRRKIDVLQQAQASRPVSADDLHMNPSSSVTSDDSNATFSSQSAISFDDDEFEESYLEYLRSRNVTVLNDGYENVFDVALSGDSNQLHTSETPRNHNNSENEIINTHIVNVRIVDGENVNDIRTIDGEICDERTINGENFDERTIDGENIDDVTQTDDVQTIDGKRRNNESPSKRSLEGDSEVYNSHRKKLKSHSSEYKETPAEYTAFLPENSSASITSNAELPVLVKKHPHGHKKIKVESSSVGDSQTHSNSGTCSSVIGYTENSSDQVDDLKTSHKKNTFGPDLSDSSSSFNSNTISINEQNPSCSRRLTRSRVHNQGITLEDNVIPNVKVRPTCLYLLNKYEQDYDSSGDESWSPSNGD